MTTTPTRITGRVIRKIDTYTFSFDYYYKTSSGKRTKKTYLVRDADGNSSVGDLVTIKKLVVPENSRDWKLIEIIEKASS